jgi:hypothetical protein
MSLTILTYFANVLIQLLNIRDKILTQHKLKGQISHGVHAQSTCLFFQILRRAVVSSKNLGPYKVNILRDPY